MFSVKKEKTPKENSVYINILLVLDTGIKPHFMRQLGDHKRGYLDRHINTSQIGIKLDDKIESIPCHAAC
jgi:hypothetical protein